MNTNTTFYKGRMDLYDDLYKRGQNVFKAHGNPCNIHKEGDKTVCAAGEPCCTDCKHLGPQGCMVEALSCKLWVCSHFSRMDPLRSDLQRLVQIADRVGVPLLFRGTREETEEELDLSKNHGEGIRVTCRNALY